jgi:hypothetical protein
MAASVDQSGWLSGAFWRSTKKNLGFLYLLEDKMP